MTGKYFVMIMDVIGSSRLANRDEVTGKLEAAMAQANARYAKDCFAPFEITRGDEVAAVLTSIANIYGTISIFRESLTPVEIRTVVVYDSLNAGLNTRHSSVIDGPAFHRGNDMMIQLKKTQGTFALHTGVSRWDQAVESIINLLLWRWSDFTPLQQKTIRLYQEFENQREVAKKINRSQQQVQRTLETCKWELIDNAENTLQDLLRFIDKELKREDS